jgi:sporulation protein YlmC with PRC-barrel domain
MNQRTRGFFMLALLCTGVRGQLTDASSHDAKTPLGQSEVDTNATALTTPAPSKIETPAVLIDDKHLESILGKEIHTTTDETLGNVTDILVDSDGSVRAAVIDLGGFLGVGVRKIAVAWSAIHFVQGKSAISAVLNMNKEQLRVAPEYHAGEPIVIVGAEPKATQPPS